MGLLEVATGLGIGVLVYGVGALTGYLFRACHQPPTPQENGFRSALALYKQTTDRVMDECKFGREYSRDILTHIMAQNDGYADKVLAIADSQLERMRIEKGESPPPKVDGVRSLADTILEQTNHDTFIPHRSGGPLD